MDPMDADIVMSPEYDVDDVDCNAEACSPCWQWLSRLGRLRRNVDGRVHVRRDPVLKKPKKAVTFTFEWDRQYESLLSERCRTHMQCYYHGELCGRCGALFTINRPCSLPELKIHHGVAHGTSSPVLEKRLTRSQSTQTTGIVTVGQCGSDQCHQ